LQSPDRRILVGFERKRQQMHFLSLPGLDCQLSLAWYGPAPVCVAENGDWLAVADRESAQLLPWCPLLDWYGREVARASGVPGGNRG
jgi:hypothetical protein